MKYLTAILLSIMLIGCSQPEPSPEPAKVYYTWYNELPDLQWDDTTIPGVGSTYSNYQLELFCVATSFASRLDDKTQMHVDRALNIAESLGKPVDLDILESYKYKGAALLLDGSPEDIFTAYAMECI